MGPSTRYIPLYVLASSDVLHTVHVLATGREYHPPGSRPRAFSWSHLLTRTIVTYSPNPEARQCVLSRQCWYPHAPTAQPLQHLWIQLLLIADQRDHLDLYPRLIKRLHRPVILVVRCQRRQRCPRLAAEKHLAGTIFGPSMIGRVEHQPHHRRLLHPFSFGVTLKVRTLSRIRRSLYHWTTANS